MPTDAVNAQWINLIGEATNEVSSVALGFEIGRATLGPSTIPEHLVGAYLTLMGTITCIQVGLVSDAATTAALARALLGAPDDEELEVSDVRDALCEIANLFCGGLKRRLPDGSGYRMGLPLFVDGTVLPSERVEVLTAELELGAIRALLIVCSENMELWSAASANGSVTPAGTETVASSIA